MNRGDFPSPNPSDTIDSVSSYYEHSWGILSTIGIANTLFGLLIVAITSLTPVVTVPIICSIACAIANGLCYYAFYTRAPLINRGVASAFSDIFWLIQEAGLSFYSFAILRRVLRDKQRIVFLTLFWAFMTGLVAVRLAITALRVRSIVEIPTNFQDIIINLHIAFFVLLAALECLSAFFLLRKFATAKSTSMKAALRTGLIQYLLRSTEVRVASLCLTGITRAVTYSFQGTAQSATTVPAQVDRFAYTIESMFPVMLYIDILASKLRFSVQSSASTLGSSQPNQPQIPSTSNQSSAAHRNRSHTFSTSSKERRGVNSSPEHQSSQDRIMEEGESSTTYAGDICMQGLYFGKNTGSSKKEDFRVSHSSGSPTRSPH